MRTIDAARHELAWRKFCKDVHWASSQWWIQHPQGPRRWELYPAQHEILGSWATLDHHLHLKARQLGFSTSVAFFAFWRAYTTPGIKILLLSKGERESRLLLDKVVFGLDRLPEWLRAKGPKIKSRTQSNLEFDNGSEILSLPSASDPARGFTGALIIVDEWAFLPNATEAWASIEPTADIGGQIIGLSTANGVGNMFHTLWVNAVNGQNMFKPMFYSWRAVAGRDDEWYAAKRRNMLPWQLHQEYPTTPEEAFIKSGASVFNVEQLQNIPTETPTRHNLIRPTAGPEFVPNPEGSVRIWEHPIPHRMYVLGVDVAEGLGHGDYSSVHVIDVVTRGVVATWHGHIEADLLAHQVYGLGTLYNSGLVCVEANNHGLTTITELRRLAYPRLWRRRAQNSTTKKISTQYGFKTTRGTKGPVIDGLAAWLREEAPLPDAETISELMSYVRADNGSTSGSPHDDRVMSLAFAVMMLGYAHQPEYELVIDDSWTLDWWARQAEAMHDVRPKTGIRPLR